jgi:hypothetical protein
MQIAGEHDHAMADEEIPDKVDLAFIARQGKRILDELAGVRGELKAFREDVAATDSENKDPRNDHARYRRSQDDLR